ncbi:MAG: hypothetical protein PHE88_06305 [Elusimicrobia bacterium]|nr:hypothetical protein [Elusimicrobiota bacterium]
MNEIEKRELEKLLKVFKFAVKEEQKAQKMYRKFQNMFYYDNKCLRIFNWFIGEEVEHERILRKKYIVFKRMFKIK